MTTPHSDPDIQVLRQCDDSAATALQALLFNDKPEKLSKWYKILEDPIFNKKYDMTLDQ